MNGNCLASLVAWGGTIERRGTEVRWVKGAKAQVTFEEYLQHLMGDLEPGEAEDEAAGWEDPVGPVMDDWILDKVQRREMCDHFVRLCGEFEQTLGQVSEHVVDRVMSRALKSCIGIAWSWSNLEPPPSG